MKITTILFFSVLCFMGVSAQTTHTTASQEGDNNFTGTNTHTGSETFSAITATGNVSVGGTLGGATAINNVQQASSTVSIATAYAALPSTGGTVALTSDITLSSATTLTLIGGKPLKLDLAGHTITCSLSVSGVCLKIIKPDATPRYRLEVAGGAGAIAMTGATTGVTGLQFGDPSNPAAVTDVSVHDLTIKGFNTASSIGLLCDWCEELNFNGLTFAQNTLGAQLSSTTTTTTIQNSFCNSTFQQNVTAAIIQDVSEFTFCDNTVQSNSAQKAFIIKSSLAASANIRLLRNHFENNGDTTNASRHISFQPAAGKSISRVEVISNVFNGGANFPAGATDVENTGATGDTNGFRFAYNVNGAGTFNTGFGALRAITGEFDPMTCYDAALNSAIGGTSWGLTFAPCGSARSFQWYTGAPGQNDGFFVGHDITDNKDFVQINNSTWNFIAYNLKTSGFYQCTEGTNPGGAANTDLFYCDSTAHRWKMNNNNGGAQSIAGFLDNLGVFASGGTITPAAIVSGGTAAALTGTGACATITSQTGGAWAGQATCTGTTGASTLTITPGTTAPHGWICSVYDQTTRANLFQQTGNVAASCTLTATSVTQNDVFVFGASSF